MKNILKNPHGMISTITTSFDTKNYWNLPTVHNNIILLNVRIHVPLVILYPPTHCVNIILSSHIIISQYFLKYYYLLTSFKMSNCVR